MFALNVHILRLDGCTKLFPLLLVLQIFDLIWFIKGHTDNFDDGLGRNLRSQNAGLIGYAKRQCHFALNDDSKYLTAPHPFSLFPLSP